MNFWGLGPWRMVEINKHLASGGAVPPDPGAGQTGVGGRRGGGSPLGAKCSLIYIINRMVVAVLVDDVPCWCLTVL